MEALPLIKEHPFLTATAAYLVYVTAVVVYRLWLSPLSKFPGPKLAAATRWYEFYYDAICHGKYTFEIIKMHEKYGPIVRISPHELHINDPEYYDVLYSRDSPRDKYSYYTGQFGTPMAAISTISHAHHRLRRSNMNPYFSMARIRKLEPAIQILVNKLCNRLKEFKGTGVPIVVQYPYTCFSTDVISDYTMGTGFHYLDEPDFIPHWSETLSAIAKATVFFKPYPWLLYWLKALPEGLVGRVDPGMNLFFVFQRRCKVLINSVIREHSEPDYEEKRKSYDHPTFFHDILDSNLPPEEKGPERLAQEIQGVIGAGSETVAKTLTWLTYYLLENKDKMDKLLEELNRLDPDRTATVVDLEKMPYLTSVMLEALRISYGVSSRLQRICPDRDLQYKEWSIPAGTPVGMTSVMMHHNEDIFPDSYNFVPERWLDPDRRKYLERYLVAFSKGSRQCVGINLARAELLLAISKIFRELKFELFETTREDVTLKHDLFLPFPKVGSKGVRVLVVD
ncbi:Cytochrome P450 family protein [Coccidioides posadasii C735 delta SOWgp]|uniref:Cytochrome P450 family protein n=1 Tax=Coccidioides posadasii (strain C735) TaxID=222929 RepID=C5PFA0_COCP7|nr:Cytochrome P450 family protein [Coccidioides posadasii C735 delta SOWgp]EER24680.1 Cytochrome P450 family protein [Coccidioides posadasii C735 delta SOWgp]|eukprot:XP_003066825.1 Cytochrome P450 family protein [Coccidioides posadasii C735 delta SOWgp]